MELIPAEALGDDRDFLGSGADEVRECSPRRFVLLDPAVPWGPVFVPGADVLLQRRFHRITQGPLRTGIQVDFVLEDGKMCTGGFNLGRQIFDL